MPANNTEYILFLDESNVTKSNPYLLLGGIIISRQEYKNVLIPNILKCKTILNNPHIIFHYTDMVKKQNNFKCLCSDNRMCGRFWYELQTGLKQSDFKVLASYINVKKYDEEYPKGLGHDSYELLFSTVINNYIHFLYKHNARGSIIFEAREETQNRKIQQYYFHILKYGTNIYQPKAIEDYITTTSFLVKEENCIGLQIADIVAYNCVKRINENPVKYKMWDIIEPKLYSGSSDDVNSYGLVKLF